MHVAFYVNGGVKQGTGHLYRCRALAAHLGDNASSVLLVDRDKADLLRICSELGLGYHVIDASLSDLEAAESVGECLRDVGADVLVLDLFEVDAEYLRCLKGAVGDLPVVALDDYSITRPIPDVVIKPHLVEEWYAPKSSWEGTILLTGPDYWILRPRLRELRRQGRLVREHPETVLATMGGSDPNQLTRSVVAALGKGGVVPHLQVVCGPAYPDLAGLKGVAKRASPDTEVDILSAPDEFDRLMFECDLAVTAGGYTVYELAALGTPMVVLPVVTHQAMHARAMQSRGAAVAISANDPAGLGGLRATVEDLLANSGGRERMSLAGRETVDGDGGVRVAEVLGRLG